jgi:hypothetical protein
LEQDDDPPLPELPPACPPLLELPPLPPELLEFPPVCPPLPELPPLLAPPLPEDPPVFVVVLPPVAVPVPVLEELQASNIDTNATAVARKADWSFIRRLLSFGGTKISVGRNAANMAARIYSRVSRYCYQFLEIVILAHSISEHDASLKRKDLHKGGHVKLSHAHANLLA